MTVNRYCALRKHTHAIIKILTVKYRYKLFFSDIQERNRKEKKPTVKEINQVEL